MDYTEAEIIPFASCRDDVMSVSDIVLFSVYIHSMRGTSKILDSISRVNHYLTTKC